MYFFFPLFAPLIILQNSSIFQTIFRVQNFSSRFLVSFAFFNSTGVLFNFAQVKSRWSPMALWMRHSRPQSPQSFWSAPRIETSGRDRSRKSANHGLPAFVRSLRNLNNNGYYRLQKWATIAFARYLAPARGLDPWRRPKGSWALGTRMWMRELSWGSFNLKLQHLVLFIDTDVINLSESFQVFL